MGVRSGRQRAVVHLLPQWLVSVSVDKGERCSWPCKFGEPQGLLFFSVLFSIYVKLLGEAIKSTSQSQEAYVKLWMSWSSVRRLFGSEWNRTHFSSILTRLSGCNYLDPLSKRCWWGHTFKPRLMHNLGIFLDSQLTAWRACGSCGQEGLCKDIYYSVTVEPFPQLGGLSDRHLCLGHFMFGLLQSALYGSVLEDHLEATTGLKCSDVSSIRCLSMITTIQAALAAIWLSSAIQDAGY